jgi:heme exporter protein CcmD
LTDVPHLGFIVAAYGATVLALAGTIVALVLDRRAQVRALAKLTRGDGA